MNSQRTPSRRSALTRPTLTRPARLTPLASIWAALVLILVLAAPALANQGPTKLYDPAVSPRAGTPTTTIVFEVTYRNREGSPPDHVSVIIDGVVHGMTGSGGTNWKAGVKSTWSTRLPVGTHTISFEAADTRRFSDAIAGGTVTISAPPPAPTPTPTPTPSHKPVVTPAPTATPRPSPTVGPTATPRPNATASPTATPPSSSPSAPPSVTPDPAANPTATPPPASSGDPATSPGASATPPAEHGAGSGPVGTTPPDGSTGAGGGPATGAGGGVDPAGPGSGGGSNPGGTTDPATGPDQGFARGNGRDVASGGPGWGALASVLETLGIERAPSVTMIPMLVGTTTVVATAFAFAIFGKKRRDEQQPAPDEVLQASAARADEAMPGVVRQTTVPPLLDAEAGMPRWRRPSLIEARKADPARSTALAQQRMSFDRDVPDAVDGRERRIIRYRVVRLLDAPDEIRSADVGQLDQGDEVQLLEKSGSYWLVRCPDGRQGWLHKMTLGEVVTDAPPSGSGGRDAEEEDVLAALLTARARA